MSLNTRLDYSPEPTITLNDKQRGVRGVILDKYLSGAYETEEVPCYCGETGGHEVALKDRYGFPVRTLLCMRCGLLRTSPRMTSEAAERFYREEYRDLYDGAWQSLDDRFAHDRRVGERMIAGLPNLMSGIETVFDVGCASGGILKAFSSAGKKTAGCDMNRRYLEYGRKQGLNLVEGDVSKLVSAFGGLTDLVLLSHVLEHFSDLKNEFEEVVEAVRPGGFVLVIVPGVATISSAYRGDMLLYFQNAHNYHFSAATLRYVLASTGVEVLVAEEEGTALVRRPEQWKKGETHPVDIPVLAGMENLALFLRLEAVRASSPAS